MLKKKMLIFLLTMIASKTLSFKACGLVKIVDGVQNFSENNYPRSVEDLQLPANGSQLSVFGWFKLSKIFQANNLLLKISFLKDQNDMQWVDSLSQLFMMTFNTKDTSKEFFEFHYAKSKDQIEVLKHDFQMVENQWFFLAFSVDYQKGNLQIYLNSFRDSKIIQKNISKQHNFPALFFIRKKLQFDIGCIPEFVDVQNGSVCSHGQAKNFNMILQYFDQPRNLIYMNYDQKENLRYLFNTAQYQQQQNLLIPVNNQNQPLQLVGDIKDLQGQIIVKGTTKFQTKNIFSLEETQDVQTPSVFMTFDFTEPLSENFLLFQLTSSFKQGLQMQFRLTKMSGQQFRNVQFSIPELNINFVSNFQFLEKKQNVLKISLVQQNNQFQVVIDDEYSPLYNIEGLQNYDLQLFEQQKSFDGFFRLIQFVVLESASGFYYLQEQENKKQECQTECKVFSKINYDQMQCLQCDQYSVLDPMSQSCIEYCKLGLKNEDGVCIKCQDEQCTELNKKYFTFQKLKQDLFQVTISPDFNNKYYNTNQFFDVKISGLKYQQDFLMKKEVSSSDPTGKTLIYELIFNDKLKNDDFEITFSLRNDMPFYTIQKNQLPIQIVVFDRLNSNKDPKEEYFETLEFPKRYSFNQQLVMPQRSFTETNFENEYNFGKYMNEQDVQKPSFLDAYIQKNSQKNKTSSEQNQNTENQTTDVLLNNYSSNYPLNDDQSKEEKNNQSEKKHKDGHHSLDTNDIINRDVAQFLFILFVIALFVGILGQFFRFEEQDFLFQKYVQMILVFQYICFLSLYNTTLPETIRSFLGPLISEFLQVQKIFDSPLKEQHSQNHNFNLDYQTYTHEKFKQHEISQHFIINSGLLFIIHACILVLLIVVSILYKCKKKRRDNIQPNMFISALRMIKKILANKLLTSMFLVFIIEITIFTLYNFEHNGFHHSAFQFSLFLAFIYFLLTIFCLMHVICHPTRRRLNQQNQEVNYPSEFGFVYKGLVNKGSGKYFQGLQYVHYFLYSLVVIIAHHKPKIQIVFHFLLLLIFSLYVFIKQPAYQDFWKFEQTFHQTILLLIFFFFMITVLDSEVDRISVLSKDIMGDFVGYLMTVILTWNSIIVMFCSIRNIYQKTCGQNKDAYDSVQNNTKSANFEMNKRQKKQEKLKNTIILEQSNEDDSQLIDNDEENKNNRMNQTSL